MKQASLLDDIMTMDVIDTHTHLVGDRLCAENFWKIADYFWLNRELQTAGYPAEAEKLPEEERMDAFLRAYKASRNTLMNIAFSTILKDLYGVELTDKASILEADERIKARGQEPGWAQSVADRLHVRRFAVNHPDHAAFEGMKEHALLFPRIDGWLPKLVQEVAQADQREEALEQAKTHIKTQLRGYHEAGCPGIMTTLSQYEAAAHEEYAIGSETASDEILFVLLHEICAELESLGMFLQLFLGVERRWGTAAAAPVNDSLRVVRLYGLFERYSIPFELVTAAELSNLDVVQAAWNFPNVHVGGMWWYNFRASTYTQSMQYRLEALAPLKSSLIVSDARCIEWTYGKIHVVKRLLAEFLDVQVAKGWIDREGALYCASEWLYGSAAKRYGLSGREGA
ncbi:glucuronate isomerase [Paenibacillus sp. SAF-054]|uniref:glucuronate isomerase n=1 Tax=unclassified Paenibacillus TaxID=185978 RepID=UPI003F80D444